MAAKWRTVAVSVHAGQAVYRGRSPRWTCAGPSAAPSVPADDSELAATVGLQLILPQGKTRGLDTKKRVLNQKIAVSKVTVRLEI